MKNKVVKEITIGGFIIPFVLYMSVFLIIIFEEYVSPRYTQWQQENERKRLEQEEAEKLSEYRTKKPPEFLQYLKDNCRYFFGNDSDSNANHLFEVQIENDFPVVYTIDFYNGDKIIKKKTILDKYIDEILYYNSYYYYSYTFLGNGYGTRINFYNDKDGMYKLRTRNDLEHVSCVVHESKDIDKILGDM